MKPSLKQSMGKFAPRLPLRNIFLIFLAIIVSHIIMAIATFYYGWSSQLFFIFREIVVESVFLALILLPILYFLVYLPLVRMQIMLAESNVHYEAIVQAAHDAIIIITAPDGLINTWNKKAEEIFGYTVDEAVGKELHGLIVPERYRQNAYDGMKKFFETGEGAVIGKTLEFSALRRDSSEFPIELSISKFEIGAGWEAVGIVRDIAERKRLEKNLERTRQQLQISRKLASLGQLTNGVCHEILNPLNIISLQVQMLSKRRCDDPDLMGYMGKIKQQIQRIAKISDLMLMFSRKGLKELEEVRIETELESALSLVEKDFERCNIKIVRNVEPGLPEIRGDADEIKQIFLAIIFNAKDAMPEGGTFIVNASKVYKDGDDFIRIKFSDTGVGIKTENLGKIFDPFFSTKPEGTGKGMGLAITHTLVEKNGGTITVESEEGKGAAFIIDFPPPPNFQELPGTAKDR